MGWKCSVGGCGSGYSDDTSGASMFRFPKNEEEKSYWINKLPNKGFVYTDRKRICSKHWPNDAEMAKIKGHLRPNCPPCLPQTAAAGPRRSLTRAASSSTSVTDIENCSNVSSI